MKSYSTHILVVLFGILLCAQNAFAQVDFNKRPDDDLEQTEDRFQELFFEALKQRGIENYQKAIEALNQCLNIKRKEAVVYFELGKNYNALKNFGAAEDALSEAISLDPKNEWYLDQLYQVYSNQNNISKAVKTLKQLVKYHPDYKEDLAGFYVKTKKYKEALRLLDDLDTHFGITPDRAYMRNQIYNITGNDDGRIEYLEERIAINPHNETNYLRLVYRYSESGNADQAFKTAQKLLAIHPESQLVHLALYKFYLDQNETQKAIKSMRTVLTSATINADAKAKVLNDFVGFVAKNPQYEQDLLAVTALVNPDKSKKTLIEMGHYYLASNNKTNALNYFEEALKQEPTNYKIIKEVLALQLDLNQYQKALKLSDEAIALFPAQPTFYLSNGMANNKLKQPQMAIKSLLNGLDYLVEDPIMQSKFYSALSTAYTLNNNPEKAQQYLTKIKNLNQEQ